MIWASGRELYEMFLESDFWRELSRRKRGKVGKCERCGSRERLQAHHKVYRDSWFDTLEEDLEVLCRECHEKEHGIVKVEVKVEVRVEGSPEKWATDRWEKLRELNRRRSAKEIGRGEFKRLRQEILGGTRLLKERKKKRLGSRPPGVSDKTWRMMRGYKGRKGRKKKRPAPQGCTPWHYSKPRMHWVNRGSSSN